MKHYFTYTEELLQTLQVIALNNDRTALGLAANMFPEFWAVFETGNDNAAAYAIEHGSDADNILWAHIDNALGHKLLGLEKHDAKLFQNIESLDESHFDQLFEIYQYINEKMHLAPVLRAALVFSDISKGGSAERRKEWTERLGMDLNIHNEASAILLQKTALLNRYIEFRHSEFLKKLVIEMVRSHGLIGQYVRGEITGEIFEFMFPRIKPLALEMLQELQIEDLKTAVHAIIQIYLLMNVLDTAAVREGLMNNALFDAFVDVADKLEKAILEIAPFPSNPVDPSCEDCRQLLEKRLLSLRNRAILLGEPTDHVRNALNSIDDNHLKWFYRCMRHCQLWYFEAATGRLSASSQIKILIMGLYLFNVQRKTNDTAIHLDFLNLATLLSSKSEKVSIDVANSRSNYRIRILDAIFATQDINKIADGTADIYQNKYIFTLNGMRGGEYSLSINVVGSEESDALITLLSIYERKSAVSFHSALKMLCDLYHLRKDDFDRLSNEAQYLISMNAAKNDKARMLQFLKPGCIVEVGPGGGVVLDLLQSHFPDSEIIGLDVSHQVVAALEQRKKQTHARWNIIEGNAFEFSKYFEIGSLTDVVFCSILHEIYSYIESDDGTRFHLESVQKMLQSAFEALAPGGRILIRDGIMPEHKPQHLQFIAEDARPFFDAFCREFKGRKIEYQEVNENTILLDSADAMEFMYTYTWGPESFPYEVREQYGVMTYTDYCNAILSWLGNRAQLIKIPEPEALVLQPGYVTALKDKVRITDVLGNPLPYPPSNAIIVIEKKY